MTVYVTGGGGTHLEPRLTSYYLTALLAGGGARGVIGRVTHVRTQQAEIDAPLDDLVIEGVLPDGATTRLDLQITTTLSFTESDEKWRDIVGRAWETFRQPSFNRAARTLGVAVSHTTTKLERSVQPLLARARHAADPGQYRQRLETPNGSNADQREFQRVLDHEIRKVEPGATDEEIVEFMRRLVIIPFDLDQEGGSRDIQSAVDRLEFLFEDAADGAKAWSALNALASRIIPSGGGVDRTAVAQALANEGYRVGADRRRADLVAALDAESSIALSSIRDTIGATRIPRDAVHDRLVTALGEGRWLRIVGEHGTGKSALLRRLAEDEPRGAPIFVLRDLRIVGGGWPAHAAKFGAVSPLMATLREFALCGSRTLFIDGLDKILDAAARVTVNDLLIAIAKTPELANWRVVTTEREENGARVDGWIDPEVLGALSSRTFRVEALDDDEAAEIGKAIPALRPLLADAKHYDRVLRRPFFLDALHRLPLPTGGDLRTEVDLVGLWWRHGGADASDFAPAQGRRNVLRLLGERLLAKPGAPLSIRDLDTVALDELLRSGVIRELALGATVTFTHDIYEEWSLHRVLSERRDDIANVLREGGQDLQLARPLQLLAAEILETTEDGRDWGDLLDALDVDDLRQTWSRVALTATVRSVRSERMFDRIGPALLNGEAPRLRRLLLSVRTTETERDLKYLDDALVPGLSSDERERLASEAASPEPVAWMRLLNWLAPRLNEVPEAARDELYELLAAWVGYIGHISIAELHVPAIAVWAREQLGDIDTVDNGSRGWRGAEQGERKSARSLLLASARAAPAMVKAYLSAITTEALKRVRKEIFRNSIAIAVGAPDETAHLLKRAYLIPREQHPNPRSSARGRSNALGFDEGFDFYPASPHRLPFLQLLRAHPAKGLELIRDLSNHAIDGWRAARTGPNSTPAPITVDLGEGPSTFFGDGGTYTWFRGTSHVHVLDSALMALDLWAHETLKGGAALDELCRQVTRGHRGNAALGIVAGLCAVDLRASVQSQVAFALVTHPALWEWDISRQISDQRTPINLMGSWSGERFLAAALRQHNELPHRKHSIRELSVPFAAFAPPEVKTRYAEAIGTFLDRVPVETEQDRDDPDRSAAARQHFEIFRQQADPGNLRAEARGEDMLFYILPPYAAESAHQTRLADNQALERVLRLYLWAVKTIESGTPESGFDLSTAYDEMCALDEANLFDASAAFSDLRQHNAQSAVSATAAILAWHADEDLWARAQTRATDVIARAAGMEEGDDVISSRGSVLSGHPPAMAAYGYAALAKRNPDDPTSRRALIQLAVDPIEKVAEAVYLSAAIYADADTDLVWRLYCLATQRGARSFNRGSGVHWSEAEAREQNLLSSEAEQALDGGELVLPARGPDRTGDPDAFLDYSWDYQALAFKLPIAALLGSRTRTMLLENVSSMVGCALEARDDAGRGSPDFEWHFEFGTWLGRLLGHLSLQEAQALLFDRLTDADPDAAAALMDLVMRNFMIEWMLPARPLSSSLKAHWSGLIGWADNRPVWSKPLVSRQVRENDRGMALSSLFCATGNELVCGVDVDWPHAVELIELINRAAARFGAERTVFAGLLKLLRAQKAALLPAPGLGWIQAVARARGKDRSFWNHRSNGEQLVILLREVIAADPLSKQDRTIIIETADMLIEAGVRGAAFLQQDMVRLGR